MTVKSIDDRAWDAYCAVSGLAEDVRLSEHDRGRVDAAREILLSVWAGLVCIAAEKAAADKLAATADPSVPPEAAQEGDADAPAF